MKGVKLKILLIVLMLVPIPFSCKDKCGAGLELYVEPYFSMQDLAFTYVDAYSVNPRTNKLMFYRVSQDYDNTVYACDSMALFIMAPDTALLYHSQNIYKKNGFTFTQEVIACVKKQPGWAGTRELIDKIYISSNYDFDDMHPKGFDLSDIVDIFAYTTNGENSWMLLEDYNNGSPYEAPKRFYLLIKQKARLSQVQQFVITYNMLNESGEQSRSFRIETPVFRVR